MATGEYELEYKYSLPEGRLPGAEELQGVLLTAGFTPHGPQTREQHDTYFDSRRRHLAQAGVALRQRHTNDSHLATFKGVQQGAGERHEREELELPLENGSWPTPIARRVAEYGPLHTLRPVLELTTRRSLYHVGHAGRVVAELAFDEVSAGLPGEEMRVHFTEVELEARSLPDALIPLADALLAALPLIPNPVSKLERAEALLSLAAGLNQEG